MKRLIGVALCLLALVGCAGDIRTRAYNSFAGYVLAEDAAVAVVTNKSVPASVVIEIQRVEKVTAPVAEALYKDMTRYANLQDELKAIKAVGGTPSEVQTKELAARLQALKDAYGLSIDAIAELTKVVAKFKRN